MKNDTCVVPQKVTSAAKRPGWQPKYSTSRYGWREQFANRVVGSMFQASCVTKRSCWSGRHWFVIISHATCSHCNQLYQQVRIGNKRLKYSYWRVRLPKRKSFSCVTSKCLYNMSPCKRSHPVAPHVAHTTCYFKIWNWSKHAYLSVVIMQMLKPLCSWQCYCCHLRCSQDQCIDVLKWTVVLRVVFDPEYRSGTFLLNISNRLQDFTDS
jgi:hypothetical protein